MILPIFAFGQPVLKKKAVVIKKGHSGLHELIENMFETMYNAKGVGLAAPQIGQSIRLFIVDTEQMGDEDDGDAEEGIKRAFINPVIVKDSGDEEKYEEGCLSIPDIQGDVIRPSRIKLKYINENFEEKEEAFSGLEARVIQHEYDHIEGVLFVEKLGPLKRKRIEKKLDKIKKGQVSAKYKMKFA
jgi:peptide deformylase